MYHLWYHRQDPTARPRSSMMAAMSVGTYSSEHGLVFIANLDALVSATIAEDMDEHFVVRPETFHGLTEIVTV